MKLSNKILTLALTLSLSPVFNPDSIAWEKWIHPMLRPNHTKNNIDTWQNKNSKKWNQPNNWDKIQKDCNTFRTSLGFPPLDVDVSISREQVIKHTWGKYQIQTKENIKTNIWWCELDKVAKTLISTKWKKFNNNLSTIKSHLLNSIIEKIALDYVAYLQWHKYRNKADIKQRLNIENLALKQLYKINFDFFQFPENNKSTRQEGIQPQTESTKKTAESEQNTFIWFPTDPRNF